MMAGFTKLFSSLVTSTIWQEDDKTRIVWITMLATADANGRVEGSIPGLAHIAHVSIQDCERALERLSAPDPYSRTKDHEGRRVQEIDGGWRILNYGKYREQRDPEKRREQVRQAVRRHRAKETAEVCNPNVSQCKPRKAQAEVRSQKSEEREIMKSESGNHDTVEAPHEPDPDKIALEESDPDPDSPDRRCYRILTDVLGVLRITDPAERDANLTALANVVKWLRDQIRAGRAKPDAYNEAIAIAKDSVNGDVPMKVFHSRIAKELGYRSPSAKRKAGRMVGAQDSKNRP